MAGKYKTPRMINLGIVILVWYSVIIKWDYIISVSWDWNMVVETGKQPIIKFFTTNEAREQKSHKECLLDG